MQNPTPINKVTKVVLHQSAGAYERVGSIVLCAGITFSMLGFAVWFLWVSIALSLFTAIVCATSIWVLTVVLASPDSIEVGDDGSHFIHEQGRLFNPKRTRHEVNNFIQVLVEESLMKDGLANAFDRKTAWLKAQHSRNDILLISSHDYSHVDMLARKVSQVLSLSLVERESPSR